MVKHTAAKLSVENVRFDALACNTSWSVIPLLVFFTTFNMSRSVQTCPSRFFVFFAIKGRQKSTFWKCELGALSCDRFEPIRIWENLVVNYNASSLTWTAPSLTIVQYRNLELIIKFFNRQLLRQYLNIIITAGKKFGLEPQDQVNDKNIQVILYYTIKSACCCLANKLTFVEIIKQVNIL